MTSERSKRYWKNGIPLNEAWLEFAPAELQEEWRKIPTWGEMLSSISEKMTASEADVTKLVFADALKTWQQNRTRRKELEIDLKERLLTDLLNEELMVTAFRVKPTHSQTPVIIKPEYFYSYDPDWHKETFEAFGLQYHQLRVVDPRQLDLEYGKLEKPRVGSGDVIKSVIDELIEVNPKFCELGRKIAAEEIRKKLKMSHFKGNGLSDQNLAKYILSKCGRRGIK